jgi:hypothetical protein
MNLHTKFDINQEIIIKALDCPGRVSKIVLDGKNLFYEVQYWFEGQLKFVTLDEDEIRRSNDNSD